MSRRPQESTLKQAVMLGNEPAVPRVQTRANRAKRATSKKNETLKKKATRRVRSTTTDVTRSAKKTTAKRTSRTKAIVMSWPEESKAAVEVQIPIEVPIATDREIPSLTIDAEEQRLVGSETSSSCSVTLADTAAIVMETCSEPEIGLPDVWVDEKETVSSETKLEVTAGQISTSHPTAACWPGVLDSLVAVWKWARRQIGSRQAKKRLRVCETVSLGEKRFVAVIEVDGEQFLVGGASSSVATLARLEPAQQFSEVLKRRWAEDPVQA